MSPDFIWFHPGGVTLPVGNWEGKVFTNDSAADTIRF